MQVMYIFFFILIVYLSNMICLSLNFQDSILTLEVLTKYSILASQATLDMIIDIEYKTKGDISKIKLTQQNPVHKPIEVRFPIVVILTELFREESTIIHELNASLFSF